MVSQSPEFKTVDTGSSAQSPSLAVSPPEDGALGGEVARLTAQVRELQAKLAISEEQVEGFLEQLRQEREKRNAVEKIAAGVIAEAEKTGTVTIPRSAHERLVQTAAGGRLDFSLLRQVIEADTAEDKRYWFTQERIGIKLRFYLKYPNTFPNANGEKLDYEVITEYLDGKRVGQIKKERKDNWRLYAVVEAVARRRELNLTLQETSQIAEAARSCIERAGLKVSDPFNLFQHLVGDIIGSLESETEKKREEGADLRFQYAAGRIAELEENLAQARDQASALLAEAEEKSAQQLVELSALQAKIGQLETEIAELNRQLSVSHEEAAALQQRLDIATAWTHLSEGEGGGTVQKLAGKLVAEIGKDEVIPPEKRLVIQGLAVCALRLASAGQYCGARTILTGSNIMLWDRVKYQGAIAEAMGVKELYQYWNVSTSPRSLDIIMREVFGQGFTEVITLLYNQVPQDQRASLSSSPQELASEVFTRGCLGVFEHFKNDQQIYTVIIRRFGEIFKAIEGKRAKVIQDAALGLVVEKTARGQEPCPEPASDQPIPETKEPKTLEEADRNLREIIAKLGY